MEQKNEPKAKKAAKTVIMATSTSIQQLIESLNSKERLMEEFLEFIMQEPKELGKDPPKLATYLNKAIQILDCTDNTTFVGAINRFKAEFDKESIDERSVRASRGEMLNLLRTQFAQCEHSYQKRLLQMSKTLFNFIKTLEATNHG